MLDVIMLVIFIICGIQLWRGKWLWLIAGYNTATKEEQSRINKVALGKAISGLLFFSALLIGLLQVFPKIQFLVAVVIIIFVGGMISYINTSPRFKQ